MLTKQEIIATATPILTGHRVRKAGLFGSFADDTASDTSDIDLLVEMAPGSSLVELAALWLDLQSRFGRKVDLVEYAGIKPLLKDRILAQELRFHG